MSGHAGEILAVAMQQVQQHQTCVCSECFSPASFALIPKGAETTGPDVALWLLLRPRLSRDTRACTSERLSDHGGGKTRLAPRVFFSAARGNFFEPHSKRVGFGQQAAASTSHGGGLGGGWCRLPHICSSALPVFIRVCLC